MSIESNIADGLAIALGHSRIYPPPLPIKVVYPAVTYVRVATKRVHSHDGTSAVRPLFQFSCWDTSALVANELARELVDYWEGLGCFIEDDRGPFWEPAPKVHRRDLDVRLWAGLDEEVSAAS